MAENGLNYRLKIGRKLKNANLSLMKTAGCNVGRPRSERLQEIDVRYLKGQIIDAYNSLIAFYREAFTESQSSKYKGFPVPSDFDSVSRAFNNAFSQKRPLPPIYWKILDELLGIKQEKLPSCETKVRDKSAKDGGLSQISGAVQAVALPPKPTRPPSISPLYDYFGRVADDYTSALLNTHPKGDKYWAEEGMRCGHDDYPYHLANALASPDFESHFYSWTLHDLYYLLWYYMFDDDGDWSEAILNLKRFCFENDARRIRRALKEEPEDVARLIVLIGENEFRSLVRHHVFGQDLSALQGELKAAGLPSEFIS